MADQSTKDNKNFDTKEKAQDIAGKNAQAVMASNSGKTYKFAPVGLIDVPRMFELTDEVGKMLANKDKGGKMMLKAEDMKLMAEMILLGLKRHHADITMETILEEFSLGDFPTCYGITLDMNDFLAGMGKIFQRK